MRCLAGLATPRPLEIETCRDDHTMNASSNDENRTATEREESPPPGFKFLAWEGVGLYIPSRWDIGQYQGDGLYGSFRVDGEDRVMIQVRWWKARRRISLERVAKQFRRNVLAKRRFPKAVKPPVMQQTDRVRLPLALGNNAQVFLAVPAEDADSKKKDEISDVLVCAYRPEHRRAAVWRFMIDRARPGFEQINQMTRGLMLQGLEQWRQWTVLDFSLSVPPGARLRKSVLASGVCFLWFVWPGSNVGFRRFSAANAVMGRLKPSVDDLINWCRAVYAKDFFDMNYRIESAPLSDSVHRLHLTGKRGRLAPLEILSLIPRHRRPPREIEIFWNRSTNKICCFEIRKRTDANRESIERMIGSYQVVGSELVADEQMSDAPAVDSRGERSPRDRSLKARILPLKSARTEWTRQGRVRLEFEVSRPQSLRFLRMLGSLSAGPTTETRIIELDLIGSMIWKSCDGRTRVCDVIEDVRRLFLISYREAERSVTEYIQTLGNRGLISLELPPE